MSVLSPSSSYKTCHVLTMRYGSLLGVLARQTAVIVPVPQASRIWIDMGSLPQNRCDGYISPSNQNMVKKIMMF